MDDKDKRIFIKCSGRCQELKGCRNEKEIISCRSCEREQFEICKKIAQ
ncbi:MAG: hypothetical protein ABFQ53_02295 [Patescibacteria group bacterium]